MSAPERIWAWPWEVNPRMGQWEADRSIAGEGEPYVPEATLTAAQAEIARLTADLDAVKAARDTMGNLWATAKAERDAAMAGRVKVKPLVWDGSVFKGAEQAQTGLACYVVKKGTGFSFALFGASGPSYKIFKRLEAAKAAAQADYEARILAAIEPDTERAEPVACPCTMFEQDESCPEGYPSLICGVCNGTGTTSHEKVAALAAEMLRIANDLGEPEDPFAAWEKVQHFKAAPQPAPAPQAREITVQEAAEVPEVKALIEAAKSAADALDVAYGDPHDEETQHRYSSSIRAAIAATQKGG